LLRCDEREAGFTTLVKRPDPEHEMAKEILSYFVRNPRAADSVEGVARWRLLDQAIHRTVDETHQALAWLVAEGFLCQANPAGSGTIFTLNAARREHARRFLESAPGAEGKPEAPGRSDDDGGDER
jgi:hypothetical protein